MTIQRGYVQGHFALELDNLAAGWLASAEGGTPYSSVVTEKLGPDHISKKHLGGINYDPITLTFGTGMSKSCYQWLKDSVDHKVSRRNGAIVGANFDHKEVSRLNFFNALISEFNLPALDANSKDAAKIVIKLDPEYTRWALSPAGGATVANSLPIDPRVQKRWLPSNFRLSIDGLEKACARISKIEGLSVKQKTIDVPSGEHRDYEHEPANLEFSNLVVTMPEANCEDFLKWFDKTVIKGQSSETAEKSGHLEFLTPNMKETLFTVKFNQLGVFKITPDKVESHAESIRSVKVEMYCEQMEFDYKQASYWA